MAGPRQLQLGGLQCKQTKQIDGHDKLKVARSKTYMWRTSGKVSVKEEGGWRVYAAANTHIVAHSQLFCLCSLRVGGAWNLLQDGNRSSLPSARAKTVRIVEPITHGFKDGRSHNSLLS